MHIAYGVAVEVDADVQTGAILPLGRSIVLIVGERIAGAQRGASHRRTVVQIPDLRAVVRIGGADAQPGIGHGKDAQTMVVVIAETITGDGLEVHAVSGDD